MPDPSLKTRADERFAHAIATSGAKDPRDFYRDRLRELRSRDEKSFSRALDYYENQLLPRVAEEDSDPVAEWLEYGRLLAELMSPGKTSQIDATGRAAPYAPPVPPDHLVLHFPTSAKDPVLVVGLPAQMSPAQRATYDLLIRGSQ